MSTITGNRLQFHNVYRFIYHGHIHFINIKNILVLMFVCCAVWCSLFALMYVHVTQSEQFWVLQSKLDMCSHVSWVATFVFWACHFSLQKNSNQTRFIVNVVYIALFQILLWGKKWWCAELLGHLTWVWLDWCGHNAIHLVLSVSTKVKMIPSKQTDAICYSLSAMLGKTVYLVLLHDTE